MKKKDEKHKDKITIKGARTHNLKNVDVQIPRNEITVFTGLSGSGKSSLAFDTIFAEGQRRYMESLSAYARQFLKQMAKPDVDEISGLSPAISIDQKSRSNNPRSTVATITEIYDYLRVLYARIGQPHCLVCGDKINKLSPEEIVDFAMDKVKDFQKKVKNKKIMDHNIPQGSVFIMAPKVQNRKGQYYQMLYDMLGKGFEEVAVDNKMKKLRDPITLSKNKKHSLDFLVDEIGLDEIADDPKNSRERISEAVEAALLEADGLVKIFFFDKNFDRRDGLDINDYYAEDALLSTKFACPKDGFSFPEVEPRLFSFNSPAGACPECNGLGTKHFFGSDLCDQCNGARLRPESLSVYIDSKKTRKNIVELTSLSIKDALEFFKYIKLDKKEKEISGTLLKEITDRLNFMNSVGLEYIALDRRANTLSGGEAQRIRLASQLGSRLVGTLYVLDEPTIGLHQRDNDRLLNTLSDLRDIGNTIVVVEHDEDTIFTSDYLVDIGPGAGVHGGEVVASGYLNELIDNKKIRSSTLDYLRRDKQISLPEKRRTANKGALKIRGGKIFNIENMSVDLPLNKLVLISGVSGSGKSTFMYQILNKNLQAKFDRRYRSAQTFNCSSFSGTEYISRSVLIDQSPIGRTPRSNVATYTGAFTHIRDIFASTTEAQVRGYKSGRFSFNVATSKGGGRCEACQGNGQIAVEMHFLPTVYVDCDVCKGKRFESETLKVTYKKKNIFQVLEMTVEEGVEFFADIPAIYDRLKTLDDVGLGYIKLGQSATTLSGGEAQRVKIAADLFKPYLNKTIYLFDEPTVGLHFEDVRRLLEVFERLLQRGHSVVVIEHNMDVIKSADYIIDIGPEGGENGGKIVAKGTPEEVVKAKDSHTGKYLKSYLK